MEKIFLIHLCVNISILLFLFTCTTLNSKWLFYNLLAWLCIWNEYIFWDKLTLSRCYLVLSGNVVTNWFKICKTSFDARNWADLCGQFNVIPRSKKVHDYETIILLEVIAPNSSLRHTTLLTYPLLIFFAWAFPI